jgi:hypothetical protein
MTRQMRPLARTEVNDRRGRERMRRHRSERRYRNQVEGRGIELWLVTLRPLPPRLRMGVLELGSPGS